ncbi:MAG: hypothetical protein AAB897_02640 [Patescibacteria group bacterium]
MPETKELQREIQYLRWNIYALAYELDKLTKQLGQHEDAFKVIHTAIGYFPPSRGRNPDYDGEGASVFENEFEAEQIERAQSV